MSSIRTVVDTKSFINPDMTTALASYVFGYDIKAIIDPCENLIFGNEIKQGTKRLQPFDANTVYYFGDIVSYFSSITNTFKLLQCISEEESGITGAFDYTKWKEYSLNQLITDYTSFTCDKPLPADIGGYSQGKKFKNEPIVKVLYNILYYNIQPEVSMDNEPTKEIYCCIGTEVLNKKIKFNLNKKGHEDITQVKVVTITGDNVSTTIQSWEDDDITDTMETIIPTIDSRCSVIVEITMGEKKVSYTLLEYYFSYPVYGVIYNAEDETNDVDDISLDTTNLTDLNNVSPVPPMNISYSIDFTYDSNPKRIGILFPEGWLGTSSTLLNDKFMIKDENDNIITESLCKKQFTISINGENKSYDGYFTDVLVSPNSTSHKKLIKQSILFKDKLNIEIKEFNFTII